MSSLVRFAVWSFVPAFIVACGGAVATPGGVGDQGTDAGPGATVDGGGQPSPGSGACANSVALSDRTASRLCMPDHAKAGTALTFTIEDQCGGCPDTTEVCDVKLSDGVVRLELDSNQCKDSGVSCFCAPTPITCNIPALDAGAYQLFFKHGDNLDQLALVVADDGVTGCVLEPAKPLDLTSYDTSCQSDFDCVLTVTGDPCAACSCDFAAISRDAADQYARDWAVQHAECPSPTTTGCGCPVTGQATCSPNHQCVQSFNTMD